MSILGKTLASKLKEFRRSHNDETQEWMGKQIGVVRATINRWERDGAGSATLDQVERFSKYLNIPINQLLGLGTPNIVEEKLRELRRKLAQKTIELSDTRIEYDEILLASQNVQLDDEATESAGKISRLTETIKSIRREINFLEEQYPQYIEGYIEETLSTRQWIPNENMGIDSTFQEIVSLLPFLNEAQRGVILEQIQRLLKMNE